MKTDSEHMLSKAIQRGRLTRMMNAMGQGFPILESVILEEDIDRLIEKNLDLFDADEEISRILAFYLDLDNACLDQGLFRFALKIQEFRPVLLEQYLMNYGDDDDYKVFFVRHLKLKAQTLEELLKMPEARTAVEEALKIQESLVKKNPENPYFLRELGLLYKTMGDCSSESAAYFSRYYEIAKRLLERSPDSNSVKDFYSISLERLGFEDRRSGDYLSAEKKFAQYLKLQGEINKTESEIPKFMNCLAIAYSRMASIKKSQGQFELAETYYKKEIAILERLLAMCPRRLKYKRNLASSYNDIALLYTETEDNDLALEYSEHSLSLREEIQQVSHSPIADKSNYYDSLETLGYIYWKQGEMEEAGKYFMRFLEQVEALSTMFPKNGSLKDNLGRAYQHVGDYYFGVEDYENALKDYQKFMDLSKERYDGEDGNSNINNYAFSFSKIARVYNARFNFIEANAYYEEELGLRRRLCELYPKNFDYRNLLGIALFHKGMNAVRMFNNEEALEALEEAHSIMKEIHDAGQKDYESLLEELEDKMEALAKLSGKIPSHTVEEEVAEVEEDRKLLDDIIQRLNNEKDAERFARKTWDLLMEIEDMCEDHEDDFDKDFYEELLSLKLKQCAFLVDSEFLDVFEVFRMGVIYEYDAEDSYEKKEDKLEALEIALKAYKRKKEEGEDDRMVEKIVKVKKKIRELDH